MTATAPASRAELEALLAELERRAAPADLQPKQRVAFDSPANEILYGGAAGGGKSHLMRRLAIWLCERVPGLQVYLFRREFADLFMNHMDGPTGFRAMLAASVEAGDVVIVEKQIRFVRTGAIIRLCHCQHERDVFGYQGAEIHVLLIDEITQWLRKMYAFLRSRVRLGGLKVPAWLRHRLPLILLGGNPGGIGHAWVKADFVDLAPPLTVTEMPPDEGGMRRQYVPAKLEDNPALLATDPQYESRTLGIEDKDLARAMRHGDWDVAAGLFFSDRWRRDVHVVAPFRVPPSWRVNRSFDWGSAKPFSVGWWAESDGTVATRPDGSRVHVARGSLFRIAEWYGWNGTPNEGSRLTSDEIARGILVREQTLDVLKGLAIQPGPADSSIFDAEDGVSIGDKMRAAGVTWLHADKRPGSRKSGWDALRQRLKASVEAPREQPGFYVFDTCVHLIRTLPMLPRDEQKRDDIDTHAEDHAADETRYRILEPRRTVSVGRFSM